MKDLINLLIENWRAIILYIMVFVSIFGAIATEYSMLRILFVICFVGSMILEIEGD